MLTKKFLATLFTFLGEHHGLRFAYRITNQPFFVEATQRIPVMSFPRATALMECEKEECEHHLIDFLFVVFHGAILAFRSGDFNHASFVVV
jgi:hypothetical protein